MRSFGKLRTAVWQSPCCFFSATSKCTADISYAALLAQKKAVDAELVGFKNSCNPRAYEAHEIEANKRLTTIEKQLKSFLEVNPDIANIKQPVLLPADVFGDFRDNYYR